MQPFLDQDGVLADFDGGIKRWYNLTFTQAEHEVWEYDFKRHGFKRETDFWKGLTKNFWADLEWTADGKELYALVKQYDPVIMTSPPWSSPNAIDGKAEWIKKNLKKVWRSRRMCFTSRKHLFAHSQALLIDDKESNVQEFREAGGHAILVPRPWNCLRKVNTVAWVSNRLEFFKEYLDV